MARLFDGTNDNLETSTVPVSGPPFSIFGWFNPTNVTDDHTLFALFLNTNQYWDLFAAGSVASDPLRFQIKAGAGTAHNVDASAGFSANVWQSFLAVEAAADDHKIYLNGGNVGTSTTSRTPSAPGTFRIGESDAAAKDMTGRVAEYAVWNAALTAVDAEVLNKVGPLSVRPENLVAYWPLIGSFSPEIDVVGGFDLTVTGAVKADHYPGIRYPNPKIIVPF